MNDPNNAVMASPADHLTTHTNHMLDLDSFKGATLSDDQFAKLKEGVDELIAQRDAARQESINGRKGKDTKISDLQKQADEARIRLEAFAERLGIEPDADLTTLPDVKGQADAAKQNEAKLNRLTRELQAAVAARDEATGRITSMQRDQQIGKALEGQRFKNASDARVLIERRVKPEGDTLMFENDEGKLVPLDEGVAWFAKTRPDYVQPSDAGGQGSGFKGGGAGGSAKTMAKAAFDALRPAERAKAMADGYQLTE